MTISKRYNIDVQPLKVMGLDQWECTVTCGMLVIAKLIRWSKSGAYLDGQALALNHEYADTQFGSNSEYNLILEPRN